MDLINQFLIWFLFIFFYWIFLITSKINIYIKIILSIIGLTITLCFFIVIIYKIINII